MCDAANGENARLTAVDIGEDGKAFLPPGTNVDRSNKIDDVSPRLMAQQHGKYEQANEIS